MRGIRVGAMFACAAALLAASAARAVPGPDSVAVLANANVPESVALAESYLAARQVPARQLCALDLPTDADISLDDFETRLQGPLAACLTTAGVLDRIEAVLLVRGVPLRVAILVDSGTHLVSLAAALGLWQSELNDGTPVLGRPPGRVADCGGTPCYAANWSNPFHSGAFAAGWTADVGSTVWRPVLVTMLNGRSYEDAARLIDSALAGETSGGARGQFVFMDGADSARGALDGTYAGTIAALADRGFTDAVDVPFDSGMTGRSIAAFFTGAASLGATIEGNTFAPGALVDNLTSFGAQPVNFEATGESQVSIARWVAMGVAGVHGTTDEPLNNVFPNRWLIVDYVDGSTLAEAFHRRLPYVYWQNLVLGDPLCAPYAPRPAVVIAGATGGETIAGSRRLSVTATDATGRGVAHLAVYVDGVETGSADGAEWDGCVAVPVGTGIQILAVAQLADDGSEEGQFKPKGWSEILVDGVAGPPDCGGADGDADADGDVDGGGDVEADAAGDVSADSAGDGADAAADDGGTGGDAAGDAVADVGGSHGGGGCGCRATGGGNGAGAAAALLVALTALGVARRRRGQPPAGMAGTSYSTTPSSSGSENGTSTQTVFGVTQECSVSGADNQQKRAT